VKAVVVGLVLLAAACGSAHAAPAPVTVDWTDDGHAVDLVRGQALDVELAGSTCTTTTVPVATPGGVLRVDSVGTSHGGAWAKLHAQRRGTATITASNGAACNRSGWGQGPQPFRLVVVVR
jgi:hypothetical protein